MRCVVDRNVVMRRLAISVVQTKDFVIYMSNYLLRHYDARASPTHPPSVQHIILPIRPTSSETCDRRQKLHYSDSTNRNLNNKNCSVSQTSTIA